MIVVVKLFPTRLSNGFWVVAEEFQSVDGASVKRPIKRITHRNRAVKLRTGFSVPNLPAIDDFVVFIIISSVWSHFTFVNGSGISESLADRGRFVWDFGGLVDVGGGVFYHTIVCWVIVWQCRHSNDFASVWVHHQDGGMVGLSTVYGVHAMLFDAFLEITINA